MSENINNLYRNRVSNNAMYKISMAAAWRRGVKKNAKYQSGKLEKYQYDENEEYQ